MTDEQLDAAYTSLCRALTEAGEEHGELFLARLALLLMHEVDDPSRIERAIAAARAFDPASTSVKRSKTAIMAPQDQTTGSESTLSNGGGRR